MMTFRLIFTPNALCSFEYSMTSINRIELNCLALSSCKIHRSFNSITPHWIILIWILCYDRRSVGQSLLEKTPIWGLRPVFFTVRELQVCWCGALSLTRGRVCRLLLLLALDWAIILESESHGTFEASLWSPHVDKNVYLLSSLVASCCVFHIYIYIYMYTYIGIMSTVNTTNILSFNIRTLLLPQVSVVQDHHQAVINRNTYLLSRFMYLLL
jgi:hypothetical protein